MNHKLVPNVSVQKSGQTTPNPFVSKQVKKSEKWLRKRRCMPTGRKGQHTIDSVD